MKPSVSFYLLLAFAIAIVGTLSSCQYSSTEEDVKAKFTETCYDGVIYLYTTADYYGSSMTAKIDSSTLQPIKCTHTTNAI